MSSKRSLVFAALLAAGASVGAADAATMTESKTTTAISGSLEPSSAIRSQIDEMLGRAAEASPSIEGLQQVAAAKKPPPKKPKPGPSFLRGGPPTCVPACK